MLHNRAYALASCVCGEPLQYTFAARPLLLLTPAPLSAPPSNEEAEVRLQVMLRQGAAAPAVLLHVVLAALEVLSIPVDQRLEAYLVGGACSAGVCQPALYGCCQ
jgi:hypothetical protein